ncbi:MAG: cobalt-zinc-cadmium resistance protein [Burkholderiaceae bacterium]|uniref:Cobalt-zinc-cadmium resistance protein n=1 Tax=Herminiimonas contaminans TaxID=1111140 RepID=A0ABS0EW27_9BURK|nr:cobalt-zinc-cadmium resistance protein [Herminiimonas contaminans]MBX9799066.1 cobalt-zinc-cadmium resistance protein [Burkholderiaceae bacterium]
MIQTVKKLLIILMLLALPLQFTWAAAAAYCQHENATAGAHFGHHKHQEDTELPGDNPQSLKVHKDFHHPDSQGLFLSQLPPAMPPVATVHTELHPPLYSSHIPDGPRRPDRHPVA